MHATKGNLYRMINILEARQKINSVPASAYIPEIAIGTLKSAMDGSGTVVKWKSRRLIQRIVAANKYCGVSDGRIDTIPVVKNEYGK